MSHTFDYDLEIANGATVVRISSNVPVAVDDYLNFDNMTDTFGNSSSCYQVLSIRHVFSDKSNLNGRQGFGRTYLLVKPVYHG